MCKMSVTILQGMQTGLDKENFQLKIIHIF